MLTNNQEYQVLTQSLSRRWLSFLTFLIISFLIALFCFALTPSAANAENYYLSIEASKNVKEGTGVQVQFNVTVTPSLDFTDDVSVKWATFNGSALAGFDYTAANGTLEFHDGGPSVLPITIDILDDSFAEGSENFTITLSDPKADLGDDAYITPGQGTGTCTIDDNEKTLTLIIANGPDENCVLVDDGSGMGPVPYGPNPFGDTYFIPIQEGNTVTLTAIPNVMSPSKWMFVTFDGGFRFYHSQSRRNGRHVSLRFCLHENRHGDPDCQSGRRFLLSGVDR